MLLASDDARGVTAQAWNVDGGASRPDRPMSAYRGFDYRIEDGMGTVTFARPDKPNSLTFEVYAELERLALECQSDEPSASWCSPAPARASARAATSTRSSASCSSATSRACSSSRA